MILVTGAAGQLGTDVVAELTKRGIAHLGIDIKELDKAKEDAEKAFPRIYRDLYEAYEDYIDAEALTDAQKEFERTRAQFSIGLISKNRLESARRILLDEEGRHAQQLIQLWLSLMEYEFSLVRQV